MSGHSARIEVLGPLISDYWLKPSEGGGQPSELILLLHGYGQSGKTLFSKFAQVCPDTAAVLAPNAPYPIPELRPDGSRRLGFSWYFYDPAQDEYVIDMRASLALLEGIVERLGFAGLPKRIVGFSQGGYLAPFVASRLAQATQVIGVASELLGEELRGSGAAWPPPYRMEAIHGVADEVVSIESARRGVEWLRANGVDAPLAELPGVGHRITPEVVEALRHSLAR